MSGVTVILERRSVGKPEERNVWHLGKGRGGDVDWQDVWCGGGVVFPSRFKVEAARVCPDCKAARNAARRDAR